MSMADRERWHKDAGHQGNALDHELNAALMKYGAVEPRIGLEERVLANVRANREQLARRSWWRWMVVGTLAVAVIVLAAILSWKPANNAGKHHLPTEAPRTAGARVAGNSEINGAGPRRPKPGKKASVHLRRTENAAKPRLDVFPSPRPLSEQEKMLASYVSEYPKEAALIAQLRTEALQREFEKEMRADETNSVR
jgi:hypothetical protein